MAVRKRLLGAGVGVVLVGVALASPNAVASASEARHVAASHVAASRPLTAAESRELATKLLPGCAATFAPRADRSHGVRCVQPAARASTTSGPSQVTPIVCVYQDGPY